MTQRTCAVRYSALSLWTSPWHFDPADRKCPRALGTSTDFHIVRDWGDFYERRAKFVNMAGACGGEVQDSPTSNGCSTSQTKTDNGKKWHWNCAAALCTNNWRTKDLTYYTLAKIANWIIEGRGSEGFVHEGAKKR